MKTTINVESDYQLLGKRVYKVNVKFSSTSFKRNWKIPYYLRKHGS